MQAFKAYLIYRRKYIANKITMTGRYNRMMVMDVNTFPYEYSSPLYGWVFMAKSGIL